VAVFDMEDRGAGLSKDTLNNLTDYLAAMLTEGGYQVIPRTQIRERLKQQQTESYKKCFDQSCQIELGKEMAAQKSLATKVLKIGKKCRVTGDLYDLKRAASEKAATAGSGCSEDELLAAVEEVAAKLTGKQVETPPPEEPIAAPERAESEAERSKRLAAEERRKTLERFRAEQRSKPKPQPPPQPARPPVKAVRTLADYVYNFTLKIGVLMPALSEGEGIELDGAAIDTDSGLFFDMQADLRMGRTLAFGAYLFYASASGAVGDGPTFRFSSLHGHRLRHLPVRRRIHRRRRHPGEAGGCLWPQHCPGHRAGLLLYRIAGGSDRLRHDRPGDRHQGTGRRGIRHEHASPAFSDLRRRVRRIISLLIDGVFEGPSQLAGAAGGRLDRVHDHRPQAGLLHGIERVDGRSPRGGHQVF
jgi:hypothetical protein